MMNSSAQNRFLSVSEVTTILGQSISTTHRRLRDGTIPHIKLGGRVLIPAEFIDNLVQAALSSSNAGAR
jgi:excisionase family DNA binding protein